MTLMVLTGLVVLLIVNPYFLDTYAQNQVDMLTTLALKQPVETVNLNLLSNVMTETMT